MNRAREIDMSDETADILAEVTLNSLVQVKAWLGQLESETSRDHARIVALREQLALRDVRIATLEEAVRYVLDHAVPAPSPGSAIVGNHAITGLKNAMYKGGRTDGSVAL